MAKQTFNKNEDTLIDVSSFQQKYGDFSSRYGKLLTIIAGVIIVGILGWIGYQRFVVAPKQKAAQEKIYRAQYQFSQDSFGLALNGVGGSYAGMIEIAKKYGGTNAGDLAGYYAGISSLQSGQFDDAIKYLKGYSTGSAMVQASAYGALADAYSEKGDMGKALDYYKKAADHSDNDITAPVNLFKAGMLMEKQGKPAEAKAMYEKIKSKYPNSTQGRAIDINLARVSN